MTCEEFAQKVSDYLDGRIPYGERVGVWVHMIMCEHCRRYYRQMREAVDLIQQSGDKGEDKECPSDLKEDLMAEYRNRHDET